MKAVTILTIIFCLFNHASEAAEIRDMKMLCLDKDQFLNTIGKEQELFLIGTMANHHSLVEIYLGNDMGWSVVVKSYKGMCILVSGDKLIPVEWLKETKLP